MARTAEFGPIIYEVVERESKAEGVTKSDVFKKIAANKDEYGLGKMTGKHGSVAASYYRVARSKAKSGNTDRETTNGNDASASATVPPLNSARPGVQSGGAAKDGEASEDLAQELMTQIQTIINARVAPVIAERDEAVAKLKQIQAAFGQ